MFHTYRNKTYHLKMFLFNSAGVHRGPVRQQASLPLSRQEQQRGGGRTLCPAGSGGGVHRDGCQVRFGNLLSFKSFDNFCKVFLRFVQSSFAFICLAARFLDMANLFQFFPR